jgi:hypothetical protein
VLAAFRIVSPETLLHPFIVSHLSYLDEACPRPDSQSSALWPKRTRQRDPERLMDAA